MALDYLGRRRLVDLCKKARVKTPREYGLGTAARSYIESPDLKRIELARSLSDTESERQTQTQISETDFTTNDPREDRGEELKGLSLIVEERPEEDVPMSQVAATHAAQISTPAFPNTAAQAATDKGTSRTADCWTMQWYGTDKRDD